nr:retrovirus-related Pol polyprotein from transposon TNT 1-94 [Tanacetum cinerariifolium]
MNYLEEQTDGKAMINSIQNEWKQYGTLMRQTKNLMDINIDALYNILKQNQGDVNDALGYKKKAVVVTSDPLLLVAEKIKITSLLAKAFNRKKYYAKPTNNNLRTSSASSSANKKPEYVQSVEKKEDKKADETKRDMSKVKCYNCKKERHFAKDYKKAKVKDYNYYKTKMLLAKKDNSDESSSSAEETIARVAYYTSESESESEYETSEYYDKSTNYGLFVNDNDDQKYFHDAVESASENFIENNIDSQKDYDKSEVDHYDSKEKELLVDKLIRKFNHKIAKCQKRIDLRPSLYDEKVIGLGYTLMFLIHSDEALEIKKFKRARENKIEFAYDYGNLNASYVNEKINFLDDYFQEIINLDFEKIDSLFQQTSSLKPYVSTVILEKIIIDLEDEVVSLLEKEKANLKTIESLKSKGFESSENAIYESENQSENDCQVVEKECDQVGNSKVIAQGMFKLNLDTFNSVRRAKHSGVIWKKKGSSNTSNVDLSFVSHSKLNKDVKRYSRKYLLSCNNSHLGETSSAYVCNDDMNVSCNSRLCDSFDENNLFIFDDESNKTLAKFFDEVGISQQFFVARTPQQNGVVERRNRTLVEAARTMLTFANLPLFLWAEAIETACFTQNRSIIHKRFDKTPYELINKRKPNIKFFRVFGCRCYLFNDYEDVGKLKVKGDIRVFVGYLKYYDAFRIYNKQTRKIHESVNVNFDEILEMDSKQFSVEPGLSNLNETGKSSNPSVSQASKTSKKYLEDLFQKFYDKYFDSSKIMKSSTTNVETFNVEVPLNEEEVFHKCSESFQEESSSSSLNDDVQQSSKEVGVPSSNT